jgi:hypothetical protein
MKKRRAFCYTVAGLGIWGQTLFPFLEGLLTRSGVVGIKPFRPEVIQLRADGTDRLTGGQFEGAAYSRWLAWASPLASREAIQDGSASRVPENRGLFFGRVLGVA